MELSEEIVDAIFNKCYLPYQEMIYMSKTYTEETAPDIACLLVPLPNGINAVAFRSEELKENRALINELVDQIDWTSNDFEIPFSKMMNRIDGSQWTKGIYEMQKLYALALASDLIAKKKTNEGYIIKRINPNQAKVTLASVDTNGKIRRIKK